MSQGRFWAAVAALAAAAGGWALLESGAGRPAAGERPAGFAGQLGLSKEHAVCAAVRSAEGVQIESALYLAPGSEWSRRAPTAFPDFRALSGSAGAPPGFKAQSLLGDYEGKGCRLPKLPADKTFPFSSWFFVRGEPLGSERLTVSGLDIGGGESLVEVRWEKGVDYSARRLIQALSSPATR